MRNEFLQSVKDTVKNWWVSLLIGILAIIVGIWTLTTPDRTLVALTYLFVASFLIFGIFDIFFAISNRHTMAGWGWTLSMGIIDVLFAIVLMILPLPVMMVILIYFIGFWVMFSSIWAIGSAVELNTIGVKGWGWLLFLAILGVIFSFMIIISPFMFGGVFIVAFVSTALMIYGIFRIYLAFMLKSVYKQILEYKKGERHSLDESVEEKIRAIME